MLANYNKLFRLGLNRLIRVSKILKNKKSELGD